MKKLFFWLLTIALCTLLCACADFRTTQEGSAETDKERMAALQPEAEITTVASEAKPEVSSGYRTYENELFITEVPLDWEIQTVKLQFTGSTISQPHAENEFYCYIEVACSDVSDETIQQRYDGLLESGVTVKLYDMTVAGQPAKVLERGGPFGSAKEIFGVTPYGDGYKLTFNCPNDGEELSLAGIQETMDHFLNCLRFKSAEE